MKKLSFEPTTSLQNSQGCGWSPPFGNLTAEPKRWAFPERRPLHISYRTGGPPFSILVFASSSQTAGAPSFAYFAKGGYDAADSEDSSPYATFFRKEIFSQPSFTFTNPGSSSR